jgi:hypothetical protein
MPVWLGSTHSGSMSVVTFPASESIVECAVVTLSMLVIDSMGKLMIDCMGACTPDDCV